MAAEAKQCCGECAHARRAVDENIPPHKLADLAALECIPPRPWWWNPPNIPKGWVEPTNGTHCAVFKRKES